MNGERDLNPSFGPIGKLDVSPVEYATFIAHFNRLIIKQLSKDALLALDQLTQAKIDTLLLTGSDAREEKGSGESKPEVMAFTKDEHADVQKIRADLAKIMADMFSIKMSEHIEVKTPQSSMIRFNQGKIYPQRTADAQAIVGDVKPLKDALSAEIIAASGSDMNHVADIPRDASKIMLTGSNRLRGLERKHFDLKTGIVTYNPATFQLSWKVGPLRATQGTIALETYKHMRRENESNLLNRLSTNTLQKLQQLSDDKMVSLIRSDVEELMDHYAFFMRLYHMTENAFLETGSTDTQLSPKMVSEAAKRLQALGALLKALKIQKPKG